MNSNESSAAAARQASQPARMRAAIERAVASGPRFLRGEIDADHMAKSMVAAVQAYVDAEQALGGDGRPDGPASQNLFSVLRELMGCGSGYLAGRCDSACVARTMTEMIHQFPPPTA